MGHDLQAGSRLSGYRIVGLVGRGGMGVVYKAEQVRLGRTVALKVLLPELAADDAFRERFDRESRLAALIDHPNILPVYEAGEADGLLFIATRWVETSDLRMLLEQEGPLGLERSLHLLGQVASALDAAHEHGLVHRDVKPPNILVARGTGPGSTEHAYLTDFGIAKIASAAPVTRTGMFVGTADYASPEQLEGRELDGRADQYALGCLFFHCLTGSRPFERTQEIAVMYAHLHDPPPRVSEARTDLPPALDAVILKSMAKQPEDRYATCSEMIGAATAVLDRAGDATVAAGLATLAPAPTEPAQAAEAPVMAAPEASQTAMPAPPREPRSRRLLWLALAAAVVIGVAVAAVIAIATGGEEASAPATDTATAEAGTTEQAETVAPETDGETATPPPKETPLTWARLESESFGGGGGQEIARVAATAAGPVAAAGSQGPARDHDVAFWAATADGESVEKQVLEEAGDERAFGIATLPDGGAIAVGYRQAEPPAGDTDAGVWLLADGGWEPVLEGLVEPSYQKMNRVTVGPGGEIVAVGTEGPGYGESGVPLATDAAVWISDDGGRSWARVQSEGFGGEGYQEIRGVTAFGDGLVGVGFDAKDGAVWRSDGDGWRRVASQPGLEVGERAVELDLRDVIESQGGLLAVGDVRTPRGDRNGAAWVSPDGETWTRVEAAAFGGDGDQQILSVVAGSSGIVAVGCSGCDTPSTQPAVWTSADAQTWERAPEDRIAGVDGPQQMNALTVAGEALVAGGWAATGAGRDAALWQRG